MSPFSGRAPDHRPPALTDYLPWRRETPNSNGGLPLEVALATFQCSCFQSLLAPHPALPARGLPVTSPAGTGPIHHPARPVPWPISAIAGPARAIWPSRGHGPWMRALMAWLTGRIVQALGRAGAAKPADQPSGQPSGWSLENLSSPRLPALPPPQPPRGPAYGPATLREMRRCPRPGRLERYPSPRRS